MKFSTILVSVTLLAIFLAVAAQEQSTTRVSPSPIQTITFDRDEDASGNNEECRVQYQEYQNSYLRYVERPHHTDFVTSYKECFRKCCYSLNFQCKSFSYFWNTQQCFLMNVTQYDDGVVLAYSKVHVHIELYELGESGEIKASSTNEPSSTSQRNPASSPGSKIVSESSKPEKHVQSDKKESEGSSHEAVVGTIFPTKAPHSTKKETSSGRKQQERLRAVTAATYLANLMKEAITEQSTKTDSQPARSVVPRNSAANTPPVSVNKSDTLAAKNDGRAVGQKYINAPGNIKNIKTSANMFEHATHAQPTRKTTGVPEENVFTHVSRKPFMRQTTSATDWLSRTTPPSGQLTNKFSLLQDPAKTTRKTVTTKSSLQNFTQSITVRTKLISTTAKLKSLTVMPTTPESTTTIFGINDASPRSPATKRTTTSFATSLRTISNLLPANSAKTSKKLKKTLSTRKYIATTRTIKMEPFKTPQSSTKDESMLATEPSTKPITETSTTKRVPASSNFLAKKSTVPPLVASSKSATSASKIVAMSTTTPPTTRSRSRKFSLSPSTSVFTISPSRITGIRSRTISITTQSTARRTPALPSTKIASQPQVTRFNLAASTAISISVTSQAYKTSLLKNKSSVPNYDPSATVRNDLSQTATRKRGPPSAIGNVIYGSGSIRESESSGFLCKTKCLNGGACRSRMIDGTSQLKEFCECTYGFGGEWCEVAPANTGEFSWWVVALIVIAVTIIVCGFGSYAAYIVHRRRNTVGKYDVAKKRRFEARSSDTLDDYDKMASYSTLTWNRGTRRSSWFSSGTFSTAASV